MRISGQSSTRLGAITVALMSATVGLAACGSSDAAGPDDGTFLLGALAPEESQILSQPEIRGSLQAAVDKVNEDGGVNGKKLKLDYCDTKFDPNQELTCVRKLVSDKVSAVLSPKFADATNAGKLFEKASIPVIGGAGTQDYEFQNPVSFPLGPGATGTYVGAAAALLDSGATKIAYITPSTKSGQQVRDTIKKALDVAGVDSSRSVIGEVNTPDWSAPAARAVANDTDGIVFAGTASDGPRLVAAVRAAGFEGPIATDSIVLSESTLNELGTKVGTVLSTTVTDFASNTQNQATAEAAKAIAAAGEDPNEYALAAYSSVLIFAEVAKDLESNESAEVLKAMENLTDPIDVGIIRPYSVSATGTEYWEGLPRMFNPFIRVGTFEDGRFSSFGAPMNPFDAVRNFGG